jgi:hypothetical protein
MSYQSEKYYKNNQKIDYHKSQADILSKLPSIKYVDFINNHAHIQEMNLLMLYSTKIVLLNYSQRF